MAPKASGYRQRPRHALRLLAGVATALSGLVGCGPSAADLAAVDYTPQSGGEWQISTPEAQGLDTKLVAKLYLDAAELETVHGLLVIKDGYLVAEGYFNGGFPTKQLNVQSVTKGYISALVGIALQEGCLSGVDQKMMDFFPELTGRIRDPRKAEITIRELLQMRAGYAWEESAPELAEILFGGFRPSSLVDVLLASDPETAMQYSNLSAHLLGIIVARACDTNLKSFAEEHLFGPLGTSVSFWQQDWEGYYYGPSDLQLSAHDMAKFGWMYLNDGVYGDEQIIPADWVRDSLRIYSEGAWPYRVGRNWQDPGYGYQWWSIRAGRGRYNLAWGHGGQQIALVQDLKMVVVAFVDPLYREHGDGPWRIEKANLNLVADFIASLD